LLGARGCGKTSVGRELARHLNRTFIDTDEQIEAGAGRTIRDFFAQDGEPTFRRLETEAIAAATRAERQVLSVGGGAVLSASNQAMLRAAGVCIWLTAPAEELFRRIQADPATAARRPPLTDRAGLDEVRHLLAQRERLYAATAHYVVSTAGLSVAQAVAAVLSVLPADPAATEAP
jgi:shikimate kinase